MAGSVAEAERVGRHLINLPLLFVRFTAALGSGKSVCNSCIHIL